MEIFGSPKYQAKAFDLDIKFTQQKEARVSMANQGIYNGMLGLLIIFCFFIFKGATLVKIWQLLMTFILVVGLFGGFTASKKIFLAQVFPAAMELFLLNL
ncbi:MAG: DUF1304 domain-containing protein [Lactobacillus sp.]|jgi:putative membrane protein|nr:DUF1304 domain-containing protein [Lactobacillus sp.]MCH4068534.1 DUF1304 domain-containing protein [Lactobacillus sp.]MCI1304171.1 DUF1304 domain-containing protein [Lactobacillus sp.]MCI1330328.1 DUF1304 domain-containing protein [Lactobacillus sp.]MCI1358925.1 DUF1304 domain-containing protein [Lactobacillus sp.]